DADDTDYTIGQQVEVITPELRHWEIGPQKSAYLPAPFLRKGMNEITVLEVDGFEKAEAFLDDQMDIG
ncbi:MAG: hypothetical protein IJB99_05875, partial [Clostridia bacterium]|nr:hypothetical protein [Clostridia bacterium]